MESSPALRFVVSCVYAVGGAYTQKPVYTRGGTYSHPLCIHTTARVYAPTCVYAPGCVYTPAAYTHPALAYSHLPRVYAPLPAPPAYTHPCLRIHTHLCIRTLGCAYTPLVYARTRVYAPTPAYKQVCVNAASGAYTHLPAYTHPTQRIRRDATNVMLEPRQSFMV